MLQANTPSKPRLLILDEDRILLQSLSQFLRREGYEAKTTDSPELALRQLEGGPFELMLADINMPGIRPQEFLREMKKRFPQVVIIVITGYGSIEGAVEAIKLGVFDYLTKPIVDDEIRVVVEKAIRQQSLLFENQTLKQQLDLRFGLENIIGHDHRMLRIFDLIDAVAVEENPPVVRPEQAENQLQGHRLPRAAGAQHDRHAPFGNGEADPVQDNVVIEGEGHVVEHHRRDVLRCHPEQDTSRSVAEAGCPSPDKSAAEQSARDRSPSPHVGQPFFSNSLNGAR